VNFLPTELFNPWWLTFARFWTMVEQWKCIGAGTAWCFQHHNEQSGCMTIHYPEAARKGTVDYGRTIRV
jgi:hypothetical protein